MKEATHVTLRHPCLLSNTYLFLAYQPRSASPKHQRERQEDDFSRSRALHDNQQQSSTKSQNDLDQSIMSPHLEPNVPMLIKSPAQMREQAQGALLSLATQDIRYTELVNEGVNPFILRRLYEDIGIRVPPPGPQAANESPPQPKFREAPLLNNSATDKLPTQLSLPSIAKQPQAMIPNPFEEILSNQKSQAESTVVADLNNRGSLAQTPAHDSQVSAPASSKVINAGVEAKLQTPALPSKNLDRKDYIAQMLAAKTGKTVPARSDAGKLAMASKPPPNRAMSKEPATSSMAIKTSTVDPQVSNPPADVQVKEKSKAQTELARQKMEQLKRQALSKAQSYPQIISSPDETFPQPSSQQPAVPTMSIDVRFPSSTADGVANNDALLDNAVQAAQMQPSAAVPSNLPARPPEPQSAMATFQLPDRPPLPQTAPVSRIPGLFMTTLGQPSLASTTSDTISETLLTRLQTPTTTLSSRKRPRASDFTDEPINSAKRPFADNRSPRRVEIEISDDEMMYGAEDGDMDIEQKSELESKTPAEPVKDSAKQTSIRDLPPLTDFPQRRPVIPSSNLTTPPINSGPQTPGRVREQEDLQRKDLEIQAMRKRIAELERRRREKQNTSGAQSPGTPNPSAAVSKAGTPPVVPNQNVEKTEVEIDTPAEWVVQESEEVDLSDKSFPETRSSELESSKPPVVIEVPSSSPSPSRLHESLPQVKTGEMEQKLKRRKEIESGLPLLDAEVERTQSRLAELQKEARRLEREIQKGIEGRKRLVQELEGLGIETDGIPTEELQAKRDQLVEEHIIPNGHQGE